MNEFRQGRTWQRVDFLKFHPGPPCPTLLHPAGGTPLKRPRTAVSGVARPQGGRPAAVFYPFGHPTPYASRFRPTVERRTNGRVARARHDDEHRARGGGEDARIRQTLSG
jgi:hypothetical protein